MVILKILFIDFAALRFWAKLFVLVFGKSCNLHSGERENQSKISELHMQKRGGTSIIITNRCRFVNGFVTWKGLKVFKKEVEDYFAAYTEVNAKTELF